MIKEIIKYSNRNTVPTNTERLANLGIKTGKSSEERLKYLNRELAPLIVLSYEEIERLNPEYQFKPFDQIKNIDNVPEECIDHMEQFVKYVKKIDWSAGYSAHKGYFIGTNWYLFGPGELFKKPQPIDPIVFVRLGRYVQRHECVTKYYIPVTAWGVKDVELLNNLYNERRN